MTNILGVLKCCKDSISLSFIPSNYTGLNPVDAASATVGTKSTISSDIIRLNADIKALTAAVSKGFSDSKAKITQLSEQMAQYNSRMQTIEDKLAVLDTVQLSLGKLTSRVETLESQAPDPTSSAIKYAQEAKEQIARSYNVILYRGAFTI